MEKTIPTEDKAPSPLTIALMSRHGGSGKSTLCYLLAHHWAREGKRVHVHDLCPSQNLYGVHRNYIEGRGAIAPVELAGALSVFPTGEDTYGLIPAPPDWPAPPWREAADADVILLDVGGRHRGLEACVYHHTDLILTPAIGYGGPTDITRAWLSRIDALAQEPPRYLGEDDPYRAPRSLLVLDKHHKQKRHMEMERERHFLRAELGGTTVLKSCVPKLTAYRSFPTFDDLIFTSSARAKKARGHIAALADELLRHAREHAANSGASDDVRGDHE